MENKIKNAFNKTIRRLTFFSASISLLIGSTGSASYRMFDANKKEHHIHIQFVDPNRNNHEIQASYQCWYNFDLPRAVFINYSNLSRINILSRDFSECLSEPITTEKEISDGIDARFNSIRQQITPRIEELVTKIESDILAATLEHEARWQKASVETEIRQYTVSKIDHDLLNIKSELLQELKQQTELQTANKSLIQRIKDSLNW